MISNQTLTKDEKSVESFITVGVRIVTISKKNNNKIDDFVMFGIDKKCPSNDFFREINNYDIPDLKGPVYLLPQSSFKEKYDSPPFRFDLTIPGNFGLDLIGELYRLSDEYYFVAGINYTLKKSIHFALLDKMMRTSDSLKLTFFEFF